MEPETPFRFLLTRPLRDVTLWAMLYRTFRAFLLTRPLRDVTVVVKLSCT